MRGCVSLESGIFVADNNGQRTTDTGTRGVLRGPRGPKNASEHDGAELHSPLSQDGGDPSGAGHGSVSGKTYKKIFTCVQSLRSRANYHSSSNHLQNRGQENSDQNYPPLFIHPPIRLDVAGVSLYHSSRKNQQGRILPSNCGHPV